MNIYDIITKKRNNIELSEDEIKFFVSSLSNGNIQECQIGAFLMAVALKGMTEKETYFLTNEMTFSGETLDMSKYPNSIDKHSSGGVGDSTSFVVLPIVVALGCVAGKMSGRGLGYTGGTIDKLESLNGFRTEMSAENFYKQIDEIGIALIGQTKNICPADKKLYAIRDITATVESIPLISASIMSKKLAGGAKNIVLDVKCGKGAFMSNIADATALADAMVKIGKNAGRNISALITNMDIPLSRFIGNSLEVYGAIEVLEGAKNSLYEVSKALATQLLKSIGIADPEKQIEEVLESGKALEVFKKMVKAQGGNPNDLCREKLIASKYRYDIFAEENLFVKNIDSLKLAKVVAFLGGGRQKVDDKIDYNVGIELHIALGERTISDKPIATLYYSDYDHMLCCKDVFDAFEFSTKKTTEQTLVYKIID